MEKTSTIVSRSRRATAFFLSIATLVSIFAIILGVVVANLTLNKHLVEQSSVDSFSVGTYFENQASIDRELSLFELEVQTQGASHFMRQLSLYKFFLNAREDTLSLYLSQSKKLVSPKFLREAQDRIVQRWSVVDPLTALSIVLNEFTSERQTFLIGLVFGEWSHINLTEAIESAQGLDQNLKDVVVDSIVISREDLSKTQKREIARKLDREWRVIEIFRGETWDSMFDDPSREWKTFIKEHHAQLHNLNDSHLKMMKYITLSRVLHEGVDVLVQMEEDLPRGFSLLTTIEFVVRELIETQPYLAFEIVVFAAGQDYDIGYVNLAYELIDIWAASNLVQAIEATLAIKAQSLQWELQKRAFEAAAQEDLNKILTDIDSLPEHLRVRANTIALVEIAKEHPKLAKEGLQDVTAPEERKLIVEAIVKAWAKKDVSEAIQWIETTSGLPISQHKLMETIFQELAIVDWNQAFQTASSLPLNSEGEGWEGTVVKWLANWNSDLAESLLVQVRPGTGRIAAYDGVIFNAIIDHDYHRALDIFLKLCELEEHADQSRYLMPLAYTVPDLVFASIDKIASSRARIKVAHKLYFRFSESEVFSTEELKLIRQIAYPDEH